MQPDEVPDSYPEEPIPPFQAKPNVSGAKPQAAPPEQPPPHRLTSSLDYFQLNSFAQDIAAYQAYADRKTGYVSLDNIQPRYPGLYFLGAISSLGKTTFEHQMADQIAASGESVLYFSLEQNRFELYSKSIARSFFLTQQENNSTYPTPSSIEIRSGREAVDHIVHRLKSLQSQYNLTAIVISSLNRQNYLTPIDFESFKESGGIEYTADVIWGLQLSVMSDELFGREGKIKEKRDKVREAKTANPRAIDLVCLKNRYGRASYTAQFNYFPASDTFVPIL